MADEWFDTKGAITVFICRFIPIVRSLISIPAGMSEMPFIKFLILTSLGTLIWNTVLTILGSIMGKKWYIVANIIENYASIVSIILVIVFIIGLVLIHNNKMRKEKNNKSL